VNISTLSNGIKVVTQTSPVAIANMGVLVDVGSRYEAEDFSGITNFMEAMLLKSTTNRPAYILYRDMVKVGADVSVTSSREHVLVSAQTAVPDAVAPVLGALADICQNPLFSFAEIEEERQNYKLQNTNRKSMHDVIVNDAIHAAAFGPETLGASMFANAHSLNAFTPQTLSAWHKAFFTGDRLVVSAVGVNHESFVKQCEEMFSGVPKTTNPIPKVASSYIGSDVRMTDPSYRGLTHVALGFNAPSWQEKEVYASSVLQMLLGSGSSFSSGGPGKGLYSRVYSNVLNKHHWIESVVSFNSIYSDAGLFGLYGTVPAEYADALTEVLAQEMHNASKVSDEECARAKNMLKSNVLTFLENSASRLEEMARFVQLFGTYEPHALIANIDAITPADLTAVARKLISSPVSIATYGDATRVPSKIVF
jgi:processing peptidase subunit alpha